MCLQTYYPDYCVGDNNDDDDDDNDDDNDDDDDDADGGDDEDDDDDDVQTHEWSCWSVSAVEWPALYLSSS